MKLFVFSIHHSDRCDEWCMRITLNKNETFASHETQISRHHYSMKDCSNTQGTIICKIDSRVGRTAVVPYLSYQLRCWTSRTCEKIDHRWRVEPTYFNLIDKPQQRCTFLTDRSGHNKANLYIAFLDMIICHPTHRFCFFCTWISPQRRYAKSPSMGRVAREESALGHLNNKRTVVLHELSCHWTVVQLR